MTQVRKDGKTHEKDHARTPKSLFKQLDDAFHFGVDAAANDENSLCPVFFEDSLSQDWYELCMINEIPPTIYCNPPYSRGNVESFVRKAFMESLRGCVVVMLLPADMSTKWFDICMKASRWIRIVPRVQFDRPDGTKMKGTPTFGSIVVVFDQEAREKSRHIVITEMNWKHVSE